MKRGTLLLTSILILPALGGCGGLDVDPNVQGDGLLDIIFAPRDVGMIAGDAQDPFDADRRSRGMLALSMTSAGGDPAFVSIYAENTEDPDPSVRAAACKALGRHGNPEHTPLILKLLVEDPDASVRTEAARSLQRIHSPSAIEPLLNSIRQPDVTSTRFKLEEDAEVRAQAALALAQYREPKVLQGLIAALSDQRLAVNRNALAALRTLTGQDFGYDRRPWAEWLAKNPSPFAGATVFEYPAYSRKMVWYEHLPLMPKPPNEASATPVGMPLEPPTK